MSRSDEVKGLVPGQGEAPTKPPKPRMHFNREHSTQACHYQDGYSQGWQDALVWAYAGWSQPE